MLKTKQIKSKKIIKCKIHDFDGKKNCYRYQNNTSKFLFHSSAETKQQVINNCPIFSEIDLITQNVYNKYLTRENKISNDKHFKSK